MNEQIKAKTNAVRNLWKWKEEDLLEDMESLKISAFTHASEIAPFVTSCTLGGVPSTRTPPARKNSLEEKKLNLKISIENDLCNKKNKKNQKQEIQKTTNRHDAKSFTSSSSKVQQIPRRVEILDYKTLNDCMQLKTIEKQRVEEVKRQNREFIEKIIQNEKNKRKEYYKQLLNDSKEFAENQHKYEEKLLTDIEQKVTHDLEKRKRDAYELHRKSEQHLQRVAIDAIVKYQKRFRSNYEKVIKIMKSISSQPNSNQYFTNNNCYEEYNKTLKTLITTFDNLKQKIKNEQQLISPAEVKAAENVCYEIEKLEQNILKDLENYERNVHNAAAAIEEQKRTAEASAITTTSVVDAGQASTGIIQQQNLKINENQQQQQITSSSLQQQGNFSTSTDGSDGLSTFVNSERLAFYNSITAFYSSKVEAVKALQADESMKKYRFACQKAINTPVNTISGVSSQHLQDKFDKIFSFITGNPLRNTDGSVISTSDHPLGRDYCLLLLAKKFVGQGDSLISSNAQAAFPIASIIVSIWKNVPDFGLLFLAYSFKESPYLVPYFLPQFKGQSNEDYFKSLGYRIVDGVLEKQDMYLKRQGGYMRLYAAVMITESRLKDSGLQHPYGLENGWKWLCSLLNYEPLPDICATLIFEFLQIAGSEMWSLYGAQFSKLLLTIQHEYFPKLSKVDEGGPKSRLEVFLQKVLQDGKIPKPQGTLAKNFW